MTIRFSNSIVKLDANGNRVLSDSLNPGEQLVNGTTYAQLLAGTAPDPYDSPMAPLGLNTDPERGLTLEETKTSTVAAGSLSPAEIVSERPSIGASKQAWFDYAVKRGYKGYYKQVTQAQLIALYGA